MTENKGDLISREALKKDFKYRLEEAKNWKENALNNCDEELVIRADATIDFICEVIMTINNAPTVEAIPTELHEKILDKAEGELLECQSNLRPQGEWIITKDEKFYHYKCQFCGFWATGDFLRTDGNLDLPNFCEKCGAELFHVEHTTKKHTTKKEEDHETMNNGGKTKCKYYKACGNKKNCGRCKNYKKQEEKHNDTP